MARRRGQFNPRLHPRRANGQFAPKGKGGTSITKKRYAKSKSRPRSRGRANYTYDRMGNKVVSLNASRGMKLRAAAAPYAAYGASRVASRLITGAILGVPTGGSSTALSIAGTSADLFVASGEARRLFLNPAVKKRVSAKSYARYETGMRRADKTANVVGLASSVVGIASVANQLSGNKLGKGATKLAGKAGARHQRARASAGYATRTSAANAQARGMKAGLKPVRARRGVYKVTTMSGSRVKR